MLSAIRPRILIGDDHLLVAHALKSILLADFEVVGMVADGRALLLAAEALKPDVILVDVGMPRLNGLDAGQRIKSMMPNVKLIYVTMNADPEIAAEAFKNGASAYVLKSSAASELVRAIHLAMNGGSNVRPGDRADHKLIGGTIPLTTRQRDVLQLLAEGLSMKEVAGMLNLATRTVAFHKYRLMNILKLDNDAELVQFAIRKHVVFLDGSMGSNAQIGCARSGPTQQENMRHFPRTPAPAVHRNAA
jgi:DNA-binding NarL/FixJ family response regulator